MIKRKRTNALKSDGERVFEKCVLVFMLIISALMLFPFLNELAKSFSGENAVNRGTVIILPKDFQIETYKYVIKQYQFRNSLKVTVLITVVGTALAMLATCMTAYPLSKSWLYGRKTIILVFVFCMLFSGGMVPSYLLMKSLGLLNTLAVLILPAILSIYNMILLKNFFEEIPAEVEESAQLDGAGAMRVLFSIILPMSLPAMATIGLFYAVSFWNNYMSGVLYITKTSLKPLQQYLYELVTEALNASEEGGLDEMMNASLTTDSIIACTVMLATVPIICVYPFLQRYFVQGLRVGSVKG